MKKTIRVCKHWDDRPRSMRIETLYEHIYVAGYQDLSVPHYSATMTPLKARRVAAALIKAAEEIEPTHSNNSIA